MLEVLMWGAGGPCRGSPRAAGRGWARDLCRGEIEFGGSGKKRGKFVKVPSGVAPSVLFDLLLAEWQLPVPNLVVSLAGEERPFAVRSWLRDVLRKGLVKAAQSTGEAPPGPHGPHSPERVPRPHSPQTLPGASLPAACSGSSLGDAEDSPVHYPVDEGSSRGPLCSLDNNHAYFVLVEPGPPGKGDGPTELRLRLEKHISEQRTGYGGTSSIEIPVLCLLVNGDPSALEAVEKQFKEKFPGERLCWEDVMHWTQLLQNITSHPHLLTVHDFEQEGSEELDTIILKALIKACKSHSQEAQDYLDELRLAVAWDRVDIAKSEIFNGDVEWKVPARPPAGRRLRSLASGQRRGERRVEGLGADPVSQGQEGVAAALAACKILREMSHLEAGAEGGRGGSEAKYEQLALGLFSECYRSSEDRAFALLVRRNRCWSKTTCLHLATEADTKAFFAHDGVQAFLTKIWWGNMASGTAILRLLGAFLCPALIYTNLITFSEEALLRTVPEGLQELDGLDSERSLLCSPGSRRDALTGPPRARGDRGPRAAFLLTRWRMFWGAPVTVFLGNVVMYFAFLFLFTYVLLVDFRPPPQGPSGPEVTLYFWVFTLVLEEIRQGFFTDEDASLVKKLTLYVEDHWNKCDMVAIFLFVVGVTCRMLPSVFEAGRAVLAVDFMVFTLRLIHIFAIHKQLGPKIIIVERMMKDVFFFLFFLSVWLVAYGVTTQALLHPHDGRLEWVFRRVLYRPYLQIFGQIPLDEIDEARVNCSLHPLLQEGSASCPNLYANWLVILLLVTFLLVTNVLLMNLLIAMFSYTFQVVQGNADMFWKFQRYHLIAEYHERPALAPPFILLSHLSLALKRLFQKGAEQGRARLERDLVEPLDQKVVTWETVQKENYLSRLERQRKDSKEEVLRKTAHSPAPA
ncbi:transient receptor potential cation [Lynx pardinus]|uniref:Transient receptor potential cation n=1 Tax=Lynx pardinus TaxID=191816 RepID=A0A485PBL3_LYNPA|nr:transient receptor potential cation [Lynx pardinus]